MKRRYDFPAAVVRPVGTWHATAACAGMDPSIFFAEVGATGYDLARATCQRCPHQAECLQEALDNDERFGMRGGATPVERHRIIRGDNPRRKADPEHGTYQRYKHYTLKCRCGKCRRANAEHERELRAIRKAAS